MNNDFKQRLYFSTSRDFIELQFQLSNVRANLIYMYCVRTITYVQMVGMSIW